MIGRTAPRMLTLAALGMAIILPLSACSSAGAPPPTPSASADGGSAPGGVTLTMWHNSADPQPLKDLFKRYEAASGNKLELVEIPTDNFEATTQSKWATGDRPDILSYHGLRTFAMNLNPAKNMVDLSDRPFVAKQGTLTEVLRQADGKIYATAIGFPQVFGYYYNKKVLAEAGVQPPKNYDEVLAACDVLKTKAPGVAPVFSAAGSVWPTGINTLDYMASYQKNDAFASSILSGEAKFTDPDGPFLKAAGVDVQLREKGCFNKDAATAKFEDSMKALFEGKAAMVGQHSDMVGILNTLAGGDTKKVDETIGFLGIAAEGPTASFAPSPFGTFYVPKTGDEAKQKAAIGFIDWVTGEGYAQYVAEAKAPVVLGGTPTPELQGLWKDIDAAWKADPALFFSSNIPGIGSILINETAKLVLGQTTPEEVAQKFQVAYEQAKTAAG